MTILQTATTSFKEELYEAVHNFLTDTINIALYTANANLNETTTVYSNTNEVPNSVAYAQGGLPMSGITVNTSGSTVYIGFPNVSWTGAITARCALIYNVSKGNKSIAVLDFGSDKTSSSGGVFPLTMPANTATTALIRSQ
jgi:hypothetical protein